VWSIVTHIRFVGRGSLPIWLEEERMSVTIIGVDPHKRSHTAVVLDDCEEVASQIRVAASAGQVDELLAWAPAADRLWAIENANGLGRLLAQQLVVRGETVVDVPAPLACRARKLSGRSGRKTDEFDARAVVIAARHNRGLRQVTVDGTATVLALLLERRWQLVSHRQRLLCQLHAVLTDMIAAGAKRQLTSTKATAMLRTITPGDVVALERKLLARHMLDDIRSVERRIPAATRRLEQALATYDTTLTSVVGISTVGAATILSIVDDPTRFATAGHFAGFTGTAPLQANSGDVERHRLSRRGNRQMNKVLHTAAVTQIRQRGPGRDYYDRKRREGKSSKEAMRALMRQLSDVVYRRLLADHQRKVVRGGHMRTRPKSA
jgi:transposase